MLDRGGSSGSPSGRDEILSSLLGLLSHNLGWGMQKVVPNYSLPNMEVYSLYLALLVGVGVEP